MGFLWRRFCFKKMVALRLIGVVLYCWHTVKCDTLKKSIYFSGKDGNRFNDWLSINMSLSGYPRCLPNCNSKIVSTYCVLNVNAALVMLDGKWSPLMISCHSFLLITSTSPPRAITRLYSSYKSNTDFAMMGRRLIGVPAKKHISLINCWVHASEIHRFYASCCGAVNLDRRYSFFARRRCKKFIASWLIFRLKKLIWKVSKNAFECSEETNCL